VFHNLLSNAAKYAPPGTTVRAAARGEGGDVVVTVRDEGPGIAPSDQARIFERFVRATDRADGTGLGLYMSRVIVSAHGGRIDVDSERGRGSTFTVRLPIEGPGGVGGTAGHAPAEPGPAGAHAQVGP
jgi:signal transduction histidine kinase